VVLLNGFLEESLLPSKLKGCDSFDGGVEPSPIGLEGWLDEDMMNDLTFEEEAQKKRRAR
jgi:hypothetical protein